MKPILNLFLFTVALQSCSVSKQYNKVIQAEQMRYAAMMAGDTSALACMMTPSLQYYHSNGKLDTKQSLLASIASNELVHKKIIIEENKVRIYQRKSAIVTGKCMYEIVYKNIPMTMHFVFTNVYTKLGGKWLLVSRQTTKID
jgi:Domain of unknown function (DUF4440)